MSNGLEMNAAEREALSALMDGELEAAAVTQACAAWRTDAALRSTWHAYQLAGDVMRSEDLAGSASRDAGFLAALRLRLADEPVVLAPQRPAAEIGVHVPMPAVAGLATVGSGRRRRRWSWMAPSAVAAGFVVVAGALVVTRGPSGTSSPASPTVELAKVPATAPAMPASQVLASQVLAEVQTQGNPGRYIRDARLDSYLAAHKQFAGTSVLGVPSGFLRNAAAEAGPNR